LTKKVACIGSVVTNDIYNRPLEANEQVKSGQETATWACLDLSCDLPVHRFGPRGNKVDEITPEEVPRGGTHGLGTNREGPADHMVT
jgi:hypothetical protein